MKLYPRDVRKAIGVEVGDLLEAKVEAGKSLDRESARAWSKKAKTLAAKMTASYSKRFLN
jgi:hypothetical protein